MNRGKHRTDSERIEMVRQYHELRQQGMTRKEVSQQLGVSSFSLDIWTKKYGESSVAPAREIVAKSNGHDAELKQLRIENQRLKMLVAEKCLDVMALQEFHGRR